MPRASRIASHTASLTRTLSSCGRAGGRQGTAAADGLDAGVPSKAVPAGLPLPLVQQPAGRLHAAQRAHKLAHAEGQRDGTDGAPRPPPLHLRGRQVGAAPNPALHREAAPRRQQAGPFGALPQGGVHLAAQRVRNTEARRVRAEAKPALACPRSTYVSARQSKAAAGLKAWPHLRAPTPPAASRQACAPRPLQRLVCTQAHAARQLPKAHLIPRGAPRIQHRLAQQLQHADGGAQPHVGAVAGRQVAGEADARLACGTWGRRNEFSGKSTATWKSIPRAGGVQEERRAGEGRHATRGKGSGM